MSPNQRDYDDYEFLLATTAENLKHAEVMRKHPEMEHDDPNGVRLAPTKSAEMGLGTERGVDRSQAQNLYSVQDALRLR